MPLALLGGFVRASYFAWSEQRDQLIAEMRLHHPRFTLNPVVAEATSREMPNRPAHTFLLFQMQVTNNGAASICQGWRAYVTNQESVEQGVPTFIPDGIVLMNGGSIAERYERDRDNLMVKTTQTPIPENGGASGWILFEFDVKKDQLTSFGNMVSISCVDALWERYWYSFPASEIKESNMPRFIGKAPFDPNLSPPQKLPESTPREMLRQDSGNI